MSGPLKNYLTALIILLAVALLVGPPVAFASKLPTACNLFQEKKAPNLKPCGHKVAFTKDKSDFGEMAVSHGTGSESIESLVVLPHIHPALFLGSIILLNSAPLRC